MSRQILIVRHAQSTANAGGLTMTHALIPLTPLGEEQAARLAVRLPPAPSAIVASPFVRTVETSRPYGERTGVSITLEPLLQEFDMIDAALIAGMDQHQRRPIADAYWQQADPDRRMGPAAETFREFGQRVLRFRIERLPGLPDGAVCFGHGVWIAMLAWQLRGGGWGDSEAMRQFRRLQMAMAPPNGGVYALDESLPGEWSLRAAPLLAPDSP